MPFRNTAGKRAELTKEIEDCIELGWRAERRAHFADTELFREEQLWLANMYLAIALTYEKLLNALK